VSSYFTEKKNRQKKKQNKNKNERVVCGRVTDSRVPSLAPTKKKEKGKIPFGTGNIPSSCSGTRRVIEENKKRKIKRNRVEQRSYV
jgi:hypothetical protein